MSLNSQPFVSVVTPVYNGEKYLAQCIESVLRQTYENWEYIIVNNCSTDRSLEIAQHYADQDPRIRIHTNEDFLALMANWNHALHQIAPNSKYCKVVHADDWLFPDCLMAMVEVAEANPSVGIVGAYRLNGDQVDLDGLPYPSTVVSGHKLCRKSLLEGDFYVFGSPTSLLIRSGLIRSRQPFYKEHIYADVEVCYNILQDTDFGFVHQVLTYTRMHNESQTSRHQSLNTGILGKLTILTQYGPFYLNHEEYGTLLKQIMRRYHRFLGRNILRRDKDFWDYHQRWVENLGVSLSKIELLRGLVRELYSQSIACLLYPKTTSRRVISSFKKDKKHKNKLSNQATTAL